MKHLLLLFIILFKLNSVLANHPPVESIENVVIMGGGPAGLTSAILCGQAHLSPLVIEGNECEGQLGSVPLIENFPGFPEGITGDELIRKIHFQAEKFGARFITGNLIKVDLSERPFKLKLSDGSLILTNSIIIASGTKIKWLGLKSEATLMGKGVSSSVICDGEMYKGKIVAVVGGGDAALEEALALSEHANKVYVIYRHNKFSCAPYLQERVFGNPKIEVIWNSTVRGYSRYQPR